MSEEGTLQDICQKEIYEKFEYIRSNGACLLIQEKTDHLSQLRDTFIEFFTGNFYMKIWKDKVYFVQNLAGFNNLFDLVADDRFLSHEIEAICLFWQYAYKKDRWDKQDKEY